jgi:hypothetical protein
MGRGRCDLDLKRGFEALESWNQEETQGEGTASSLRPFNLRRARSHGGAQGAQRALFNGSSRTWGSEPAARLAETESLESSTGALPRKPLPLFST